MTTQQTNDAPLTKKHGINIKQKQKTLNLPKTQECCAGL